VSSLSCPYTIQNVRLTRLSAFFTNSSKITPGLYKSPHNLNLAPTSTKMPSQTPTPIALPVPRRRSPLLVNASLGQDVSLFLSNTLNSKAKAPYNFISRIDENDYSPPAPPPPSPVNFPSESWSTACSIRR
jgi:hypothetical protein